VICLTFAGVGLGSSFTWLKSSDNMALSPGDKDALAPRAKAFNLSCDGLGSVFNWLMIVLAAGDVLGEAGV
jgi:hypothetical protein